MVRSTKTVEKIIVSFHSDLFRNFAASVIQKTWKKSQRYQDLLSRKKKTVAEAIESVSDVSGSLNQSRSKEQDKKVVELSDISDVEPTFRGKRKEKSNEAIATQKTDDKPRKKKNSGNQIAKDDDAVRLAKSRRTEDDTTEDAGEDASIDDIPKERLRQPKTKLEKTESERSKQDEDIKLIDLNVQEDKNAIPEVKEIGSPINKSKEKLKVSILKLPFSRPSSSSYEDPNSELSAKDSADLKPKSYKLGLIKMPFGNNTSSNSLQIAGPEDDQDSDTVQKKSSKSTLTKMSLLRNEATSLEPTKPELPHDITKSSSLRIIK
jgi:hypothetical protein